MRENITYLRRIPGLTHWPAQAGEGTHENCYVGLGGPSAIWLGPPTLMMDRRQEMSGGRVI